MYVKDVYFCIFPIKEFNNWTTCSWIKYFNTIILKFTFSGPNCQINIKVNAQMDFNLIWIKIHVNKF
jgi:hypothetical protein